MVETPKKVHVRHKATTTNICRLCRESYRSDRLSSLMNEDLDKKLFALTGIHISHDDHPSLLKVCRNCKNKLNKFWEFRLRTITKEKEANKETIVTKRGILTSPSHQNLTKKLHTEVINNPSYNVYDHSGEGPYSGEEPYTYNNEEALHTADPSTSTKSTRKRIPFEKTEIPTANNIFLQIENGCEKLLKRKGKEKSYLHNHSFEGMANFDFTPIFEELQKENPYLIECFNAVTGKNASIDNNLKNKYALIYGILMNARWHEFSLVQRVIAVLAIEGGCSTKVSFCNYTYTVCETCSVFAIPSLSWNFKCCIEF